MNFIVAWYTEVELAVKFVNQFQLLVESHKITYILRTLYMDFCKNIAIARNSLNVQSERKLFGIDVEKYEKIKFTNLCLLLPIILA